MRDHLREKRSKITTTTTKTCKKTKVDLKFALVGGLCKKNNINFNERLRKKGIKGVEKMDHMYGQVCSCFGFILYIRANTLEEFNKMVAFKVTFATVNGKYLTFFVCF